MVVTLELAAERSAVWFPERPVGTLMKRAASAMESAYPVAYDERHQKSIGYWICRTCMSSLIYHRVEDNDTWGHARACEVEQWRIKNFRNREAMNGEEWKKRLHRNLIYVFGPNISGEGAPFPKESIEKIKKAARCAQIRSKI